MSAGAARAARSKITLTFVHNPMRWSATVVVGALIAAACGVGAAVETESIDAIDSSSAVTLPGDPFVVTDENPTTTTAPDEVVPATTTTDSVPDDSAQIEPDATTPETLGDTATGLGNELFPELGAPDVDVISYDVRLDVDVSAGSFAAVVGVVADVTPGVAELVLDAQGLSIDSVTIDGEAALFDQIDDELLIALEADRSRRVAASIVYSATPDETFSVVGLPAGWFKTAGGAYVLNEPDGSRRWMPSNDHPSDKATWRFEIAVPDDVIAIANGELVQEGSATLPWIWNMDEAMPTYLVQLVIGDYTIVDGLDVVSATGRAIPITNVAPADLTERMQPFFDETAEQVRFFEALFGPYPLDAYGLAFINSPPGLAMETQGRSLFSVGDFRDGNVGYAQHLLLAHEIVHQWFGNAVSPATWSDIWLAESFATYGQMLWLDEAGFGAIDQQVGIALDRRQNGRFSTGDPTLMSLFGYESYDGGAVVLHALRLTIGDDAFFDVLRRWVAENNGTSQSTDAFIALAEDVSGLDLKPFFDDWLFAADLPDQLPS